MLFAILLKKKIKVVNFMFIRFVLIRTIQKKECKIKRKIDEKEKRVIVYKTKGTM